MYCIVLFCNVCYGKYVLLSVYCMITELSYVVINGILVVFITAV